MFQEKLIHYKNTIISKFTLFCPNYYLASTTATCTTNTQCTLLREDIITAGQ